MGSAGLVQTGPFQSTEMFGLTAVPSFLVCVSCELSTENLLCCSALSEAVAGQGWRNLSALWGSELDVDMESPPQFWGVSGHGNGPCSAELLQGLAQGWRMQ